MWALFPAYQANFCDDWSDINEIILESWITTNIYVDLSRPRAVLGCGWCWAVCANDCANICLLILLLIYKTNQAFGFFFLLCIFWESMETESSKCCFTPNPYLLPYLSVYLRKSVRAERLSIKSFIGSKSGAKLFYDQLYLFFLNWDCKLGNSCLDYFCPAILKYLIHP